MIHLWTSPEILAPNYYHRQMIEELSEILSVKPSIHYEPKKGVHVLFVLARWLFQNIKWFNSLKGPRIVIEHDAYLNRLKTSHYFGEWTKLYQKSRFDIILSSGKNTTNDLKEDGIPAIWLPKATNRQFFDYKNQITGRIGYFSCPIAEQETGELFDFYQSRREMGKIAKALSDPIACPFSEFATTISRFSAAITDDRTMNEPMAKQFECSALGCAMIRDRQEELYDLGFEECKSVVSFENYSEMRDIIFHFRKYPESLIPIQEGAREVARNHTWRHRALQVREIVKSYSPRIVI